MSSGDFSPDDSNLGTSDLLGSSVYKGNLLTEVESGLFRSGDTFNLDERTVWVVDVL